MPMDVQDYFGLLEDIRLQMFRTIPEVKSSSLHRDRLHTQCLAVFTVMNSGDTQGAGDAGAR